MPLHHYFRLRWSEGFSTASDLPPGGFGASLESHGMRCLTETRGEFGVFASDAFPRLGLVWTLVGEVFLHNTGRKALFQHTIAAQEPLPGGSPGHVLARAFERLYGRDEAGRREAAIAALYSVLSQTTYEETSDDVRELFITDEEAVTGSGSGEVCLAAEVAAGVLRRRPDLRADGAALPDVRVARESGPRIRPQGSASPPAAVEVARALSHDPLPPLDREDVEETDPGIRGVRAEHEDLDSEITAILPDGLSEAPDPGPAPEVEPEQPPPVAVVAPYRTVRDSTAPQRHTPQQPPPQPEPPTLPSPRRLWIPGAIVVAVVAVVVVAVRALVPGLSDPLGETQDATVTTTQEGTLPDRTPSLPAVCLEDKDGDGFAVSAGPPAAGGACAGAEAFKTGVDCDDADAAVYPGAEERCDGLDGDCDGSPPNSADATGPGGEDACLDAQFAAASMKLSLRKDGGVVLVNIRVHPAASCDSVKVGHGAGRVTYGDTLSLRGGAIDCSLRSRTTGSKAKVKGCGAPAFNPNALADDNDGQLEVAAQCCRTWGKDGERCKSIAGGQGQIRLGL